MGLGLLMGGSSVEEGGAEEDEDDDGPRFLGRGLDGCPERRQAW